MDKFQQIRINIQMDRGTQTPVYYRINAQTDKDYKYLKGIYVSFPSEYMHYGSCLGLKIGQTELFDEQHETKLLCCGHQVSPNDKFFRIDGKVEAAGNEVKGLLTLGLNHGSFEAIIYLWLTNEQT